MKIQDTLGSMFIGDPTFVGYSGLRKLWDCMLHWRHFVSSKYLVWALGMSASSFAHFSRSVQKSHLKYYLLT